MGLWSKSGHRSCDSIAWLAFEEGDLVDRQILLCHSEVERHLHEHEFLHGRHPIPNTEIDMVVQN